MRRRSAWSVVVALAVGVVVGAAAVAQSIREHSLEPIWTVGWIPAVLVASLARPHAAGQCRRRRSRP
jgi:cytosine/uracil/thiamine/allantoin permease